MRISIAWLKEYVPTKATTETLARELTMVGLEAEEIVELDPGVADVVVARIRNVLPHPNSDRLSVCEVETGSRIQRVVCGAPNARPGLIAPLAMDGSRLPNGMTIRSSRIRGVESDGMLCSAQELGLSDDASGLLELPDGLRLGQSLRDALGLDDTTIDLNITPNRPDCLSIVGVAREVATVENLPLSAPIPSAPETAASVDSMTSVQILEPTLCPRYAARVLLGVRVGPSPDWIQKRLNAVGVRTINNVVDVTNYVLVELGHPLHAFDYDLLAEHRIVVRRARPDETMTTLDGVHRSLTTETLVIADAEKPVALAGIMGGASSEVSEATVNVLLESAYFNPISIRRTAKALGVSTEASFRFERGADIEGVIRALDRAAELIAQTAGGDVCRGVVDVYPDARPPVEIALRPERVASVLGADISVDEMKRILIGLGCDVASGNPIRIVAPTFRPDLTREIDLIEEVARVWGYDNIPTTFPTGDIPSKTPNPRLSLRRELAAVMRAAGYNEAYNYGFTSPQIADLMRIPEADARRNALVVANPLSVELSVMRTSLLPSLMQNLATNRRRRVDRVALFEIAREFHPIRGAELPNERWMLAGVAAGAPSKHWDAPAREPDFYDVKGIVEALLKVSGVADWKLSRSEHPSLHPGRSASITVGGSVLATFGEAHPGVMRNFDLSRRAVLFEVDLDALAAVANPKRTMQAISPFPSALRDLAVVVSLDTASETVTDIIRRTVPADLLGSLSLFDVYIGDRIPANRKSLAYSIEYRSLERTLTDAEVDNFQTQIVRALSDEVGAQLRT